MKNFLRQICIISVLMLSPLVAGNGNVYAAPTVTQISTGNSPDAVGVNPVTNKIYVMNASSGYVTAFNGVDNIPKVIMLGDYSWGAPSGIAVNPITNRIYISHYQNSAISVIDGATDTLLTTITTGANHKSIAINVETNRIYVTNYNSNSITVIDGISNYPIATIPVGSWPLAIAVNPVTNKIYVTNQGDYTISVIDGTSKSVIKTVGDSSKVGYGEAIAVNSVTNKIYAAGTVSGRFTVIDGATDTITTFFPLITAASSNPPAVAVNSITNKIYVADGVYSGKVYVIDGLNDTLSATVTAGMNPHAIAVNPVTNTIYVGNGNSADTTAIDGSNTATTISGGGWALGVNVTTNSVYTARYGYPNAYAINESSQPAVPLTSSISALPGNQASNPTPTFTFTTSTGVNWPAVRKVYYQVDSINGAWKEAGIVGTDQYSATSSALSGGSHTIYSFATDGQDSTSVNTGPGASPLVGAMASYTFSIPTFAISTSVPGGNGTVSCDSPVTLGGSSVCTITPNIGYHLATFTDDGLEQLLAASAISYTISNVIANHTISATFAITPFTGSVAINSGAAYTTSADVTLNLACTNTVSGCTQMRFSNDNLTWESAVGYATTFTPWTLSVGYGLKTVYVKFMDGAGNWSNPYRATIVLSLADINWKSISAGVNHTAAIKSDGTLWRWGLQRHGSEGGFAGVTPLQIGSATNWVNVSAGIDNTLAIDSDGKLWGTDGYVASQDAPFSLLQIGSDLDWSTMSAGPNHNLALKSNGTLWAWGRNFEGQLGDGTTAYRSAPVQVGSETDWYAVATGDKHSVALKTNGTLWTWGDNSLGQLGNGTTHDNIGVPGAPVQVGTDINWVSITAGRYHTVSTKTNGTLWSWGGNWDGELGIGNLTPSYSASPVQIGLETDWVLAKAGYSHAIALKSNGTLWAWGRNDNGQLGDGSTISQNAPIQIGLDSIWVAVSTSNSHTIALKLDGSLWAWGANSKGELGNGTTVNSTSPVQGGLIPDLTAPTSGTLTATPGKKQIILSWSGFSDASGIASYKLISSSSALPTDCSGTAIYNGTAQTFTVADLADNTTRYFGVCATDNAGNSSVAPVTASATTFTASVILWETFDLGTLPPGWSLVQYLANNRTDWSFSLSGNPTGGSGGYAIANQYMDSAILTPHLNLTGTTNPVLEFKSAFPLNSGSATMIVSMSTDGGSTWAPLWQTSTQYGATTKILSLAAAMATPSDVVIRFNFVNNDLGSPVWAIDDVKVYDQPIITLADALENPPGLTFTTGGNGNWFGQSTTTHDAVDAAQSGAITHSQSTWVETTVTGPSTLSFWWKVSSESGYDYLGFTMDQPFVRSSGPDAISGTTGGWETRTYTIPSGTHTLRWTYAKDNSVSSGSDAGWLDQVVFTIPQPTVTGISPANSALDVSVNRSITATFNMAMDAASITASTFTLSSGSCSSVTYNSSTNTATCTLSAPLNPGTVYTTTITTGVKNAYGNNMAANYSWSFTTGLAPIGTTWARTYGGAGYDGASSIQQTTPDGGYIMAGYSEISSVTAVMVTKLDSLGAITWQKTYAGGDWSGANSIQQTADRGYIVAGEMDTAENGYGDVWLLKLSSTGTVEWEKTYGGTGYDYAQSVRQTADGGYIVAAYTESYGTGGDAWFLKLDDTGTIEWQKTFGGADRDYTAGIQQTSDGYIATGTTFLNNGTRRALTLKLDSSGAVVWQKTFEPGVADDSTSANSVEQTADSGYIVSGLVNRFLGNTDALIIKLDSLGAITWQKTYAGGTWSAANSILQTADGGYIVAGKMETAANGYGDAWLLKLSSTGAVEWEKTYGGSEYDDAQSVSKASDGGYLIAGYSDSYGGHGDAFVLKLDANGNVAPGCGIPLVNATSVTVTNAGMTATLPSSTLADATLKDPGNGSPVVSDGTLGSGGVCSPRINLDYTLLDFGVIGTGQVSSPQIITATNVGYADLTVSSAVVSDTTNYTILANTCGLLVSTSTCTVTAQFNPMTDGTKNSTLTVASEAPAVTVALTGASHEMVAPTGSIAINPAAAYTNAATINLTLSCSDTGSGCSQMQFSNDGSTWSASEVFATTKTGWALSASDGLKTVYVMFQDVAGNWSTPYTASITLDTIPPSFNSGTRSVITIASGLLDPRGVVVDADGVYFGEAGSNNDVVNYSNTDGRIRKVGKNGGVITTLATGLTYPALLTSDAANVYWMYSDGTSAGTSLKSLAKTGGTITPLVTGVNGALMNAAVDDTSVYWLESGTYSGTWFTNTASINKIAKDGSGAGVKVPLVANTNIGYGSLAIDSSYLYWGGYISNIVGRVGLDGSNPITLAPSSEFPTSVAVDATSVYWRTNLGSILRKNKDGSGLQTKLAAAAPTWDDGSMLIDADNVYWNEYSHTTLRSIPKAGGTATTLLTGLPGVAVVADTTGIYWAERGTLANNYSDGTIKKLVYLSAIVINSGDATTNKQAVTLALSALDANGVSQMKFSNDGITFDQSVPYATSASWNLAAGDGVKTVFVMFKDVAGNWSAPYSSSITLDTTTPAISVTPASPIPFNNVIVGSNASTPITISNTGLAPLTISPAMSITGSGDFSIVTSGGTCASTTPTITSGVNCTFDVKFAPSANGSKTATLTIVSNDPFTPTVTISLTGTGIPPVVIITPSTVGTGPGTITTFAGGGNLGEIGPATAAMFNYPAGVAVDSTGNVYIADFNNNRIRKVDTSGNISTFAGNGTPGYSGDGKLAVSASLNSPSGVAFDSAGNVYIADTGNGSIRKVDTSGKITTVAGNGSSSIAGAGDGELATAAQLNWPVAVAFDGAGNLYIADQADCRIRKVSKATGVITTIAGTGNYGGSGDGSPATAAMLSNPMGVVVDVDGNVYIADWGNNRIRKIDNSGTITTMAGYGTAGYLGDGGAATSAMLNRPTGVAIDITGNIYIGDQDNNRVRKVDTSGIISTIAGNGTTAYSGDTGPATSAALNSPTGIAVNSAGTVFYIADSRNNVIRKIAAGIITTFAGRGIGDNGPATSAVFAGYPKDVAFDGLGNTYIADNFERIRKVDASGTITTFAGTGKGGYSGDGGPASSAQLNYPLGVAADSAGNVYISDDGNGVIRKVDPAGIITTLAAVSQPMGIAVDRLGNVYVAQGWSSRMVKKIDPSGTVTTFAGTGVSGDSGDGGPATEATFNQVGYVAVDAAGNVYIGDTGSHRIRKVDAYGIISTIAGDGNMLSGAAADGVNATSTSLAWPYGVSVDGAGNVYFVDGGYPRIRKVDPSGIITTIAGSGSTGYFGDNGPALDAMFNNPLGIRVDSAGNVYVADEGSIRVRKITLAARGGTINPSTPQSVAAGGSATFAITPDSGYKIVDVLVDGTSVGAVPTYSFSGLIANHAIGASFINQAPPTASITNTPVTYTGSVQTATVACLGGGVATLATGGTGTNAGSYPATVDCAASTNYSAATGLSVGNFVISKASPTASITNSPVDYNGSVQTATVACLGGGTATLASGGTGTNAGSYPATVNCAASTNYASATGLNAGSFVINAATPTANITNTPVTYNGSAQTAAVACLGGGTATLASGGIGTNVGTYSATVDCAASTNYAAATGLNAGNFAINPANPTASITNSPVAYNGSVQNALVACLGGGTATLATGGSGTNAGSYPATVDCAASTNYAAATGLAAGNFIISQITPTASVTSSPITYNGSPQAATAACLGGGTASNILVGGAVSQTTAGTHAATVDCAASTNYSAVTGISAGNFVISKASPTASITNTPVTYNSSVQTATVACLGGGTAALTSGGGGINAGSYPATVDCAASTNYNAATGLAAGSFVINQITPTASVINSPVIYNGSPQAATAICLGGGAASNILSGGAATQTNVGTYAVTVDCAASTNYTATAGLVAGNLIINKITPVISWANPADITYGTALSGTQLNATSGGVAGTFVYTPASGTVLSSGAGQTLSVTFTPTDTANYNTPAATTVTINVAISTFTITPSATAGGTISPNTAQLVTFNGSIGFTMTPNAGFTIIDVLVDGSSIGAVGSYTFSNVAASHTIAVTFADITAPDVSIGTTPASLTNQTTAIFNFSSTDGSATFECNLDGASYGSCATPQSYSSLADGSHSFSVQARDLANNISAIPASFTWTIDTSAPGLSLDSTPPSVTAATSATFTFSSPDGSATFQCKLDGGTASACTSPQTYSGLVQGSHTFSVQATDNVGNPSSPANFGWIVDTTPPNNDGIVTATSGNGQATLSWTPFTDAVSSVSSYLLVYGTSGTIAADCSSGTPASSPHTVISLTNGTTYDFRICGVDAAGNKSSGVVTSATPQTTYVTINPANTAFGAQATGTTSTSATFSITNGGPVSLNITSLGLVGAQSGDFTITGGSCGIQPIFLTSAASCTVEVAFAPQTEALATRSSVLAAVTDEANTPTASATLSGIATVTIAATAGTDGTITPAGTTTNNSGSSQSYTITANTGYHVADVLVDGGSVGAVSSYSFSNVTANHTISVSFAINVTPVITWANPADITYGTALSATQLNATSGGLAGTFVYTPSSGTLSAGTQTLSVTFTPTDTTNYTATTKTVTLAVNQAAPVVTWATPAAITYGTVLSATQLNATASVAGTFAYTPDLGTTPTAGTQTLSVTFTPTDAINYTAATKTVTLVVNPAAPVVTWATPAAITYGTALTGTQLNATASVAGTFAYTPALGTTPTAGTQTLSVTFNPTDATNYSTATKTVSLVVSQLAPIITWANPASITYGTALSATQLNATSSVAGTFVYSPSSGTLSAGTQALSVTFTPTDAINYATATAIVTLTVNQSTPVITWANPAAITYGTALNATQLNAAASAAGTFIYNPANGTNLAAGAGQSLSVTFIPTDADNYTAQAATVTIDVTSAADRVTPNVITFAISATATTLTVPITTFSATDNVGVSGYLLSESATPLPASDPAWTTTAPVSYLFTSYGFKTLYAFTRDAAGNISAALPATVAITLPDTTLPTVTAITIPATATTLTLPVIAFTATDNVGVTGYLLSEESAQPSAQSPLWTATAPASFSFSYQGARTLYAFAKDASGNISGALPADCIVTLQDKTLPKVDLFALPASSTNLTVPVLKLAASDNSSVITGYFLKESPVPPAANNPNWKKVPPASYTFSTHGARTVYAFTRDGSGNVSGAASAMVDITPTDLVSPTVDAFTIPPSSTTLTVPISAFTASDNVGVTGYLLSESSGQPSVADPGWVNSPPASHTFSYQGNRTLYAFGKDAVGNVSGALPATVNISLPDKTAPTVISFSLPTSFASLTVPVTNFSAIDNSGVTGYMLSEDPVPPSPAHPGWTPTPWGSYTFTSQGGKSVYAYAKDGAGNVSSGFAATAKATAKTGAKTGAKSTAAATSATVTISLPDATAPTISSFALLAAGPGLTVPVTSFTATDNVGVTGYLLSENQVPPSVNNPAWTPMPWGSYTFVSSGSKTVYAFARDAVGNISSGLPTAVSVTSPDVTVPVVNTFTVPAINSAFTVMITGLTASDNTGVAWYLINESATPPQAADPKATPTPSGSYTFATPGAKTLYAYAIDAYGNVSLPKAVAATVSLPATADGILIQEAGKTAPNITDALKSLRFAMKVEIPTATDISHGDVAPLVNGVSQPDGAINLGDTIVILRRVVGL